MSNKNISTNLSVALLISDLEEVKEITNVFRKLGVIPYFYEDLKSFWQGTLERIPSIAIVDVKKMSEGSLVLKNHPSVMTEELPLLFYYSESTEPLLVSTQEIFHLGTIKKSSSYEGLFKGLLKRINKMILLEQENHNLKFSVQAKTDEIKILEEEKNHIKKIDQYQMLAKNVCQQIAEINSEVEFFVAMEKLIQNVEEFEAFSMVELSFNGQKLISPISHAKKFRAIPSLWLGQVCKDGIELFAQNMASQVALEILGRNVVSIIIRGNSGKPDRLLFIKSIDELCFNNFDWTLLEAVINGFYSSAKLREKNDAIRTKNLGSTFEAMTYLDQFISSTDVINNSKAVETRLINLDLSSIVDIVLKNGTQRFFWSKFKSDFIARFELQCSVEFTYFENGVSDLAFLVNANDVDKCFDELKDYSNKFSYWKYFENNDAVIFQEVRPEIYMTAMSAYAYLKKTSERQASIAKNTHNNKIEIHWDRV